MVTFQLHSSVHGGIEVYVSAVEPIDGARANGISVVSNFVRNSTLVPTQLNPSGGKVQSCAQLNISGGLRLQGSAWRHETDFVHIGQAKALAGASEQLGTGRNVLGQAQRPGGLHRVNAGGT